ncbi:hypothetical protein CCP2SC5_90033 [Azospirillaceae bacterium]
MRRFSTQYPFICKRFECCGTVAASLWAVCVFVEIACALAFVLATSVCPALASARVAQPAPDQVFHNVVAVAGKQVPLPTGTWRVMAVAAGPGPEENVAGAYKSGGVIESMVLGLLVGDEMRAVILIHTNLSASNKGWGVSSDCVRTDMHYAEIAYSSDHDGLCFFVNHVVATEDWLKQNSRRSTIGARAFDLSEDRAAKKGAVDLLAHAELAAIDAYDVVSSAFRDESLETRVLSVGALKPEASKSGVSEAKAWRIAQRMAHRYGWRLPHTWLMAGFRISDSRDVLDVRYYFDPETASYFGQAPFGQDGKSGSGDIGGRRRPLGDVSAAASWSVSDWSPSKIRRDPDRMERVQAMTRWASAVRPAIEDGFRNRLSAEAPGIPTPWRASSVMTDAAVAAAGAARIQYLDGLLAARTITENQYRHEWARIQNALGGVASVSSRESPKELPKELEETPMVETDDVVLTSAGTRFEPSMSSWRLVSFPVVGYLVDWALEGFLGGWFSGAMTSMGVVVLSAAYVLHETTWSWLTWSEETPRLVDFPGLGLSR